MKKFAVFISLFLLSMHIYAASPKETLEAYSAAMAAGDKQKAAELLSPDITIYESGYVERSRAEYVGHHMEIDMAYAKNSMRKVLSQGERIEGNLAILWQESETTGTYQGKDINKIGTETAILEKKGDQWKIVHLHWSSRKPKPSPQEVIKK